MSDDTSQGLFPRVGSSDFGYDPVQVERFLQRSRATYEGKQPQDDLVTSGVVRRATFDPLRGGYEPREVDAALDRLEDVFAARERKALVAAEGEDKWIEGIAQVAGALRQRLHRPHGERFRRAEGRTAASYSVQEVDALCDRLLAYFEQDAPLAVDDVRRAVFARAEGSAGYEENQVDAFLDSAIELMASID